MSGDFDTAREMVDRAVALNPNSALAWEQRGWTCAYAAQDEEAVRSFERAIRLSPLDPMLFSTFTGMSFALISLGRFDDSGYCSQKGTPKKSQFFVDLSLPRGSSNSSWTGRRSA
jgi:adenylate cyclase